MRATLRQSRSQIACLPAIILIALAVGGCARATPSSETLQVVTTTTVFADIVRQVAGARATVTSIVPIGVGPEDYEPRTEDSKTVADAQLIVSNGIGLDDFLDGLLSATGAQAARLVLGEGIPTVETAGEPNPHFWLDPSLVGQHYLPKITAKLAELDPGGRASFDQNAEAYRQQIEALDTSLKAKVEEVPAANRKLVTFHDAFPYFARHYGFELVGVIVENVGQEPSAGELAELVDKVKAAGAKAVFSEAQFNPKLAQTLAEEAGITKVITTLYNDALGEPPADTYLGMMRWNVDQVVDALK
jgi:zinc/manganese transport system substrate-binding protein/manganese/iron transport system substrate-binding protein